MSDTITITVRMNSAARFTIGSSAPLITPSITTVLQLKQIIAGEESLGRCPVERQRLIYKGRILNDGTRTLADYGIVDSDQTIHLVKGSAPASNGPPDPTTAAIHTNQTNASASPPQGFQEMQRMMQSQQQPFNMQGAEQMQQELLQNPEMTQSIMSSPMMQNLMSNPDFIRNMMDSNPQMRQVLEANPELRNMLDDPETMRRSMEMMRDPNAMRNAMRNQDLAMSQIENIPGGFSALRRMYEDVQEPMLDAFSGGGGDATAGGGGGAGASGNQTTTGRGAAGNAMPNPWSSGTTSAPRAMNMNTSVPPALSSASPMAVPPNPWAGAGGGQVGPPGANNPMNLEQTISMLENPMVSQMMDQMMSNPAAMQSLMDSNPMLRQMRETNPQVANMMSNPEMMRSMMNPENLRAMSQMQSAMQQMGGNMPGFPAMPNTPGMGMGMGLGMPPPTSTNDRQPLSMGTNNNTNNGMDFSSLLNQFQSTSVSGMNTPNMASPIMQSQQHMGQVIPPEQRYRLQLQSLNDMGFDDNEANISALTQTHGNVNRSVDVLFSSPPSTAAAVEPSAVADVSSTPDEHSGGSGRNNSADDATNEGGDKKND